jgi:DNA-binding transcriptional ArsR family regulator
MVEYALNYNSIFQALADETRRDILLRLMSHERTITELAQKYNMSFAAIAKHLGVLEAAALVTKRKQGRTQIVSANPIAIHDASEYLQRYQRIWDERFNNLEALLKEGL